jgi:hypothetical protein
LRSVHLWILFIVFYSFQKIQYRDAQSLSIMENIENTIDFFLKDFIWSKDNKISIYFPNWKFGHNFVLKMKFIAEIRSSLNILLIFIFLHSNERINIEIYQNILLEKIKIISKDIYFLINLVYYWQMIIIIYISDWGIWSYILF